MSELPKVTVMQLDAQSLTPIPDNSVDRIVTTCLMSHLTDIEAALREFDRVTTSNSCIDLLVVHTDKFVFKLGRLFFFVPKLVFHRISPKAYFEFAKNDHVRSSHDVLDSITKFAKMNNYSFRSERWVRFPSFLSIYERASIIKNPTS